jgi:hypothetical protein
MCTVILAQEVLAPKTLLLAANRDEEPSRPSAEPAELVARPRVVGGRDLLAGGTWLAVREARAAVALLNRRPPADPPPRSALRSRGLLTVDVAAIEEDFQLPLDPVGQNPEALARLRRVARSRLGFAGACKTLEQLWAHRFAPFSLLWASPEGSWVFSLDAAGSREYDAVGPGWHVITHEDLDDRSEPRTAWVLDQLADWQPSSFEDAARRLGELMRSHGGDRAGDAPPVCLHRGRGQTVSSSIVLLGALGARYLHASGPPCTSPYEDHSMLVS